MARLNDAAGSMPNINSSPPSGSDHTHFNTPSTNVTVMSPDTTGRNGRVSDHVTKLYLRDARVTAASHSLTVDTDASHKLSAPPTTAGLLNLSPTANEFTPLSGTFAQVNGTSANNKSQSAAAQGTSYGAVGQAVPGPLVIENSYNNAGVVLNNNVVVALGKFSDEEKISRILEIFTEHPLAPAAVVATFTVEKFASLDQIDSSEMHLGIHRIIFKNIGDARAAYIEAKYLVPYAHLRFLSPKNLAIVRGENPALVSNTAAQVIATVQSRNYNDITMGALYGILHEAGDIYAVHSVDLAATGPFCFRVEFSDVRNAEAAIAAGCVNYREALVRFTPYGGDARGLIATSAQTSPGNAVMAPAVGGPERRSLTGRSTVPYDRLAEVESLLVRLMSDNTSVSRTGLGRSGHNQVDIFRIQSGADVRTTIMLRNIPNKVTQSDLKHYLDETSHGSYDFMYLRIDFANNCNVGYAFINFVDPLAIIPFARRRAGAKWNVHDSNKVAEISYATIQGRDCLIQKFRNSSVMLEHPSYRPKLYFTGAHPVAGEEECFPGPDNFSKMRRSIENAEHVGLYYPGTPGPANAYAPAHIFFGRPAQAQVTYNTPARITGPTVDDTQPHDPFAGIYDRPLNPGTGLFAPREGQQHREEQRRRRSQFDRGTPGAEFEAQMRLSHNFGASRY